MKSRAKHDSDKIKAGAAALGFDYCGISKAGFLEDQAERLEDWLKKDYQGQMAWMANHFDKRLDPTKLMPGAKSVISLMLNYYPKKRLPENAEDLKISKYAYGVDYHVVMKQKMKSLFKFIHEEIGEVAGRVFVDSAPVMDKAWAVKSGLAWMGKHSNVLNRTMGSFFFLGEIICDLELEYDGPIKDYCGSCTACMDACPTEAIPQPYVVDGSKCISYYTIELKEAMPNEAKGKLENWIFGCDICQDVCPWNRFAKPHKVAEFMPGPDLEQFKRKDWEEISEEIFNEIFKRSAIQRTKLEGLKRNVAFVKPE